MKAFPGRIQETGIILLVKNYQKCVHFYSEKLGLPVRKQKPHLTNFNFGGGYLLIESSPKKQGWKNGALRINVPDVTKAAQALRQRGLKVLVYEADWGVIGRLFDPDGNQIELCKWK
ncbi:MAG TPA: VOC family protein [bacterium]|jgi:lactoylglutathione lyase|nr:VOC family protein [bacterium]